MSPGSLVIIDRQVRLHKELGFDHTPYGFNVYITKDDIGFIAAVDRKCRSAFILLPHSAGWIWTYGTWHTPTFTVIDEAQ